MSEALTPMMRQYLEAKKACPDAILLFRMGDFYELFFEDARIASKTLNLALTSRDKGENGTPMAGFPHHQLETYLAKLIRAGYRVAVCDQVEDPRQAKGLVKRDITRIVTAGTLTDEALLDPREPNYLAAAVGEDPVGLAWVDLSTGRFQAGAFPRSQLADALARIAPAECLVSEEADLPLSEALAAVPVTKRPGWAFAPPHALPLLEKHFGTRGLEGFGFADTDDDLLAIGAAGAVLDYLQETQRTSLTHIDRLQRFQTGTYLELDEAARRSLEVHRTLRDGRREGSLLWVLDRAVTAMGSRRLSEWLASPLTRPEAIARRHDALAELLRRPEILETAREELRSVHDLERLLARVATGRCSPRDLSFVAKTLSRIAPLKQLLSDAACPMLREIEARLDPCPELQQELSAALVDPCPLIATEGGLIRDGYHPNLDEWRSLAQGGKQWIAAYQAKESQRTGIPTLKVGYNKVFGYYIEVTQAHQDKIPPDYIRKQTLKNAERFITPELKEYEDKVLTADEKAKALEYELFLQLRQRVTEFHGRIRETASAIADLDVLAGLADLARHRNYCRPELTEEPILQIVEGRHPVLDITQPEGTFIPNDTRCGGEDGAILLITGPNMAGKSTYIRQTALLVLMAQIGSFIPAKSAVIGIADRIHARVGAGDELSRGRSTFMVEMIETARILNTATPRSLVILDEIGRGTSTYDGISLAWATVEYLHQRVGCRTLFATHYHELTELAELLPKLRNFNVAVREWQDEVVFLHKIVPGAADKSYGIHVARLAGVPRAVIDRAKEILAQLEEEHQRTPRSLLSEGSQPSEPTREVQLTLFEAVDHPIVDEIRDLDLTQYTPLALFDKVREWQEQLRAERKPGRVRRSR